MGSGRKRYSSLWNNSCRLFLRNYSLYKKELLSSRDAKPSSVFSLRGLVLFVALMLEKKYISEMLDKIDVFFTPSTQLSALFAT